MEEILDVVDEKGVPTGQQLSKATIHQQGLFHQTVHIWFYTINGELLLQQRGARKKTFPLLWDVSVAGHIAAGEAIETAALREIHEEIGLAVNTGDLYKIGIFKTENEHHKNLIDREFHHTFICELQVSISSLQKEAEEVADLKLITIPEFKKDLMNNPQAYVPASKGHYEVVFQAVYHRLEH
ncbi:MAG: NUDIX domain-containing protein [Croceitalea sp.]|nr:NUDIX domain-containing protein [Croceitalea sp.]